MSHAEAQRARRVMRPGGTLNAERSTLNSQWEMEISRLQRRGGSGDWAALTAEMKRYAYEIGPTGQIAYAAPSGYHDDCVMALALGVWAATRSA